MWCILGNFCSSDSYKKRWQYANTVYLSDVVQFKNLTGVYRVWDLPRVCWLCCCLVWGSGQTDLSLVRTLGRFAHGTTRVVACSGGTCYVKRNIGSLVIFWGQVSVYWTSGTKEFRAFLFDVRRCGGIWFPTMNWKPQSQDHLLLAKLYSTVWTRLNGCKASFPRTHFGDSKKEKKRKERTTALDTWMILTEWFCYIRFLKDYSWYLLLHVAQDSSLRLPEGLILGLKSGWNIGYTCVLLRCRFLGE